MSTGVNGHNVEQINRLEEVIQDSVVMVGAIAHDTSGPIANVITAAEIIDGLLRQGYSRSKDRKKYTRTLFISEVQHEKFEGYIANICRKGSAAIEDISRCLSELRDSATTELAEQDVEVRKNSDVKARQKRMKELKLQIDGLGPLTSKMTKIARTPLEVIRSNFKCMEKLFDEIDTCSSDDGEGYIAYLTADEYKSIRSWMDLACKAMDSCEKFIDWILEALSKVWVTRENSDENLVKTSVCECIMDVLGEYDINSALRKRIIVRQKNDFEFMGPAILLHHVLLNLVNNALKYTDAMIEIWSDKNEHDENIVHVKDYGKGIEESKRKNIFKTFASYEKGGTGIGLAFCSIAMKILGGSIECESEPGEYTEFCLKFPKV